MSQKKGLALTHNYVNRNEFCDFDNNIVWYSPLFEVFKMGCIISVGQGTEIIRPDMVESQNQPFFDSPFSFKSSFLKIVHLC